MRKWNPSSWFPETEEAQDDTAGIKPGYGKGELAPPKPAPVSQVVVTKVAPPPMSPSGKLTVGLLLPLTGPQAEVGKAMLNAAQMAVFDVGSNNFELLPRDTAQTGAADAAKAVISSGAQLIIGPLFSAEIGPVKALAAPLGLSLLPLSTDVTQAGRDTYVMGFAPGAQVERVVAYAAAKGARHFAALVTANAYGVLVQQAFNNAVMRAGGVVVASESYDPQKQNSAQHVQSLALVREQIDALFIPVGGADLALIGGQLASAGFDNKKIKLLGTGLWDEVNIAATQKFLVGGYYAAPDPAARRNFVAGYMKTYGTQPPRLATLAYDATALAATLSKRGAKFFDENGMTNPSGFVGVDGIFRLFPGGRVERGLAVNEVGEGGSAVVDPAPMQFTTLN